MNNYPDGPIVSICPLCHHYFDERNGLVIPSLSHVTIERVEEHLVCLTCRREMDNWPRG